MGASIKPSDAHNFSQLEQLISSGEKPPKLSSTDLHALDIDCVGISSLKEALQQRPFQYLDHRALTRYLSKVCLSVMMSCEVIQQLQSERQRHLSLIKKYDERIRKYYRDLLRANAFVYRPFQGDRIHFWAWDSAVHDAIREEISKSGLTISAFLVFCAGEMRGIESLERIADDLSAEYEQGLRCMDVLLALYQSVNQKLE